jgi:diacylglycerol kinase family enzyme
MNDSPSESVNSVYSESFDRPLLLVGNPTSRSGKAARRIELVAEIMSRKGIPYEFRSTLPNGETVQMVRDAIDGEGFETVVYMGGDGTFYEVATAICTSSRPNRVRLGMLPSGTANDQGKSFGISSEEKALPDNIDIIAQGHTDTLDVGEVIAQDVDGRAISKDFFFDSVGWGLSAAILAFRNRELKLVKKMPLWREMYRDQAVYVRAAVHELALHWATRDRFAAEISVDGWVHTFERLSDIVVSNTMVYAGEWIIDPQSAANDGILELAPFSGLRDWTSKLIVHHKKTLITEEMLNRIGVSHTPNLRGKEFRIHLLRPAVDKRLPAQRDGEEFVGADDYIVRVIPRLLTVIVPKNFHWI